MASIAASAQRSVPQQIHERLAQSRASSYDVGKMDPALECPPLDNGPASQLPRFVHVQSLLLGSQVLEEGSSLGDWSESSFAVHGSLLRRFSRRLFHQKFAFRSALRSTVRSPLPTGIIAGKDHLLKSHASLQ